MRPEEVREALAGIALVRRIYVFDELASTSDWAKALITRANGSLDLEGTLVIANYQSAGRGRFDRRWVAPPGTSLLFSFILPAQNEPGSLLSARQLAIAVPVAICAAIENETRLSPRIKFPNDVLLNHKKVSGILIESVTVQQRTFAILGIGLNTNQDASELPEATRMAATSIRIEAAREINTAQLLAAFFLQLAQLLANPDTALARMNLLCETLGTHIQVSTASGTALGVACGVTPEGALVLRTETGMERVIHSGDVLQVDGV
ncbi:MAG: biotin--[acetyl-CoA-carboxylase] ligase [Candidatus Sumerlaeaceae bacterium]